MKKQKILLLKNARLMPLIGSMDSFTAGIYTQDNHFVLDSLIDRGQQADLYEIAEHLDGAYIFGGYLFAHFGHFIWESLSRLHTFSQCKELPILFLTPSSKVHPPFQVLFNALRIKNEIRIVKQPTSVASLLFSAAGSSLNPLYITDEQMEALVRFDHSNEIVDSKIWLSRSKLQYGKITNEVEIEEGLRQRGFTVIHPELLALAEQVKLISSARVVAGFDGSAFYSALFARKVQGEFYLFNRRGEIPEALEYALQKKGIPFHKTQVELKHVSGERAGANYCVENPEAVISALSSV